MKSESNRSQIQAGCAHGSKPQKRPHACSRTCWVIWALVVPTILATTWNFCVKPVSTPISEDIQTQLRGSPKPNPCPRWALKRDLAKVRVTDGPAIQRYTSMDTETFKDLVDKGEPFVLSGFMAEWPSFGKYNCEYLFESYPDVEYFDWQGDRRIRFGDIKDRPGYSGYECAAGYVSTDATESNEKNMQEWANELETPEFMRPFMDLKTVTGSLTGFIGTPNTGIAPHLDELCQSLISIQFSGIKLWSVSRPIQVNDRMEWSKPYVFKIHPGEMLIWFPGQRHHTEVSEGCSFSLTYDLRKPAPVAYFHDLHKVMSAVTQEESDRFFKEINAADVRYLKSCQVHMDGNSSYITYSHGQPQPEEVHSQRKV